MTKYMPKETKSVDTCRVIFDNGGGITVQLNGWAHYYDRATWAADDVAAWLESHDTSEWEGHEDDALSCDPSEDEIIHHAYCVWPVNGYGMDSNDILYWGDNTRQFFSHLDYLNPDL